MYQPRIDTRAAINIQCTSNGLLCHAHRFGNNSTTFVRAETGECRRILYARMITQYTGNEIYAHIIYTPFLICISGRGSKHCRYLCLTRLVQRSVGEIPVGVHMYIGRQVSMRAGRRRYEERPKRLYELEGILTTTIR